MLTASVFLHKTRWNSFRLWSESGFNSVKVTYSSLTTRSISPKPKCGTFQAKEDRCLLQPTMDRARNRRVRGYGFTKYNSKIHQDERREYTSTCVKWKLHGKPVEKSTYVHLPLPSNRFVSNLEIVIHLKDHSKVPSATNLELPVPMVNIDGDAHRKWKLSLPWIPFQLLPFFRYTWSSRPLVSSTLDTDDDDADALLDCTITS
jgi:hypothetical protein